MRTRYVTTDLDLESASDLGKIAEAFGDDVCVHFLGKAGNLYRATFGLPAGSAGEDEEIGYFCTLAEALDGAERELWSACTKVDFNLGYEAGTEPKSWISRISAQTLERVARLGGDLVVTVYPADTHP